STAGSYPVPPAVRSRASSSTASSESMSSARTSRVAAARNSAVALGRSARDADTFPMRNGRGAAGMPPPDPRLAGLTPRPSRHPAPAEAAPAASPRAAREHPARVEADRPERDVPRRGPPRGPRLDTAVTAFDQDQDARAVRADRTNDQMRGRHPV